jgi:hypothetical protein
MSYFTAVFKDLPADELIAIAQDERCRFMSHSHVGHERDDLRQILRDAYEVYAGSEGIPEPETAAEAYVYQLLMQMKDEIARGLK